MAESFIPIIVLAVLFWFAFGNNKRKGQNSWKELTEAAKQGVSRIASDGHRISAEDDISCARYGHDHSNDPMQKDIPKEQFIVHNEPPEGYINLNGKIIKLTEADEYMNRHG